MSYVRVRVSILTLLILAAGWSPLSAQSTQPPGPPPGSWRVAAEHSQGHQAPATTHGAHGMASQGHGTPRSKSGPVHITMEELHKAGGVPPGWMFSIPAGEADAGRRAFMKLQCYSCHAVSGGNLPHRPGIGKQPGVDLGGMGGMHPAEYFAEAILNPNKVIIEGEGHTGKDGLSIMPLYPSMSLQQLIDLVAFLSSLKGHPGMTQPMKMKMKMK